MKWSALLGLILRHALTAGGGALAASGDLSPEELSTTSGAAMALVGVALSVLQKRKAAKAPSAPPASVRLLPLLLMLTSVAPFTGCATRPDAPPPTPEERAALIDEFLLISRPLAEGLATAVLANNPRYAPFVCALGDGLGLALDHVELTPALVDQYTRDLRARHPEVDAQSYALARTFILSLHALWRQRFGPVQPSDPATARVLTELGALLRAACAGATPPGT